MRDVFLGEVMWFRLALALFLLAFASQISQAAQMRRFNVAGWYAGAYTNDATGEFSHCAGTATYGSGIGLTFSINRAFHWSMGLSSKVWRLQVGIRYPVAFTVDQLAPIRATAVAIASDMIAIQLTDSATLFQQFQKGYVLHIATPQRVFSFNLTRTSKLLPALLACAQNRGQTYAASTNPFASNPGNTTASNHEANGAEATAFAANLLSAAGVNKFKFLTPAEYPTFHGDARWIDGSTVGTVDVIPQGTPEQLKDLAAFLIGRDAKSCKGAFLSGAMPAGAGTLAHVFTTCRADGKPVVVYYLAVPRKGAGAYLISIASIGSDKPAKEADANFTAAVLKIGAN